MSDSLILALAKQWIAVERKRLALRAKAQAEHDARIPKCNGNYFAERDVRAKLSAKYLPKMDSLIAEKDEVEKQLLELTGSETGGPRQ